MRQCRSMQSEAMQWYMCNVKHFNSAYTMQACSGNAASCTCHERSTKKYYFGELPMQEIEKRCHAQVLKNMERSPIYSSEMCRAHTCTTPQHMQASDALNSNTPAMSTRDMA